ncbi:unnamed protein product [Blepharisma stoltei]|uniref:Uncharacterized protein n=1 Tax=Blepharisma stoltei TaxID=1481888 RepID=A0AAU9KE00_9CILI|nr:unnamed protein product [Blepharisma stoltei]
MLIYKRGLTLAMNDINGGTDILQNFQLKLNDFDCGVLAYNATFNYNCLKKGKDTLGLAHIFSPGSELLMEKFLIWQN